MRPSSPQLCGATSSSCCLCLAMLLSCGGPRLELLAGLVEGGNAGGHGKGGAAVGRAVGASKGRQDTAGDACGGTDGGVVDTSTGDADCGCSEKVPWGMSCIAAMVGGREMTD